MTNPSPHDALITPDAAQWERMILEAIDAASPRVRVRARRALVTVPFTHPGGGLNARQLGMEAARAAVHIARLETEVRRNAHEQHTRP